MSLEYDLRDSVDESHSTRELKELKLRFAPRNQCKEYILENGGVATLVKKEDFDFRTKRNLCSDGPYMDRFGDSYGEPYNPERQAFGKLRNGKIIYCELLKENQKGVERLFRLLDEF